MMTFGEMKAGAGKGVQDVLCVRLDRSITAGVVADGRLQTGAQGHAGLIGHAPTGEGGEMICHCGAQGCLDVVASGEAVAREAAAAASDGRSRYLAEMWSDKERSRPTTSATARNSATPSAPIC